MFGPTIFDSAEEKIMFRREVRRFLQKEVVPTNKERAKLNHVPQELWKKIADQQLLRVNVPEKYGGEPADWITVGILVEEIGRADFLLYHPLLMVHLAWLSLQSASDELQMEWMPALLSGDKVLSVGLTEPECGSDAAAIIARAERNGSDYIINGEKVPVTQGMSSDATLVWASTDKAAGARGITCFLMPHDLPGVTRTPVPYLGYYQLEAATMVMQGVRVPESLRVGKEGDGFYMVMRDFDVARIILALACLGAAQISLEEAIAYSKERRAFGKPICKYEAVSHKIAHHATQIQAARLLCYHALWLRDQRKTHTMESSMAKWFSINEVAVPAIHDALLIHGQYGYSEEYNIVGRLKDVLGLEIGDGTADIQKLVIARELIGEESLPYR